MARWVIRRIEGILETEVGELPGHLTETEIVRVLQRLVCMTLTPEEILLSSLRRRGKKRASLLDRVGSGTPVTVGSGEVTFSAQWFR